MRSIEFAKKANSFYKYNYYANVRKCSVEVLGMNHEIMFKNTNHSTIANKQSHVSMPAYRKAIYEDFW